MSPAVLAVLIFVGMLLPVQARAQLPGSQIVFENDSVRVTVFTFPPGTGTGRHQGIAPEMGIVVEGEVTVESPSGRQVLRPAGVYWMPGLTPHDARNEGARPARMFDLLLKRCD